jgi:DNA-binding MarR family transcriptional regulator
MNTNKIDAIVDEIFQIFPLAMKKFKRSEQERFPKGISLQDISIIGMLYHQKILPTSEIGKRLLISKPQMTYIIDRLIKLGIVERSPDKKDRRIINIKLTRKGKFRFEKHRNLTRTVIRKKLRILSQPELEKFSGALAAIKEISEKLE